MRRALIVAALVLGLLGARDLVRADDVRTYTVVCTTTRDALVYECGVHGECLPDERYNRGGVLACRNCDQWEAKR